MLCAAIDIGSNTTRMLVAEAREGQLRKVREQRVHTHVARALARGGEIGAEKAEEIGRVVSAQLRLARELGADPIRIVATAAFRDSLNGRQTAARVGDLAGAGVEVLSEHEEGRLAFIGATRSLSPAAACSVGVVDVGGASTEVILGRIPGDAEEVRSWRVGSGVLADDLIASDPPSAAEIRTVRERIEEVFEGVAFERPARALAVGGSAASLRRLLGAALERESLERGLEALCSGSASEVAWRFELDPERVRLLPAGVLLLEKLSTLLAQPLQIGKGGLREGVILDLLDRSGRTDQ